MRSHLAERLDAVHPKARGMSFAPKANDSKPLGAADDRRVVGRWIERALVIANITKQEASLEMGYAPGDQSSISKWIAGTEPAQFARLWRVEKLRGALVVAMAEDAEDAVEVHTVVKLRRRLA